MECVDVIVESHNDPALTSLIESWSNATAMRNGSRMIIENSLAGSSKSNGMIERTIKSVHGMINTLCRSLGGTW